MNGWLADRCPAIAALATHIRDFPTLRRGNWIMWTSGAWILSFLALLIPSGLILALYYQPDTRGAFLSVAGIMRRVPSGWFIRLLHQAGVDFIFFALYAHLARGVWHCSYKQPRELAWLSGWGLLCLFLTTAFAGYVLPWGQMSYWAATVAINALNDAGFIPGVDWARYVFGASSLSGASDPSPGTLVLHRAFVLHFTIGLGCIALIAWHVTCVHDLAGRRSAPGDPQKAETARLTPHRSAKRLPFWPYFALNDLAVASVLFTLCAMMLFLAPLPLGEPGNLMPANPDLTPAIIRPPWYLVPFFTLLRAVPTSLGGIAACLAVITSLALLPWLDASPAKRQWRPPWIKGATLLYFVCFIALGVLGSLTWTPLSLLGSRLCLAGLLLYPFVLLPLWAWAERTGKFTDRGSMK